MRLRRAVWFLVLTAVLSVKPANAPAALPPPEDYLPDGTLAHVTLPHVTRARAQWAAQAPAQAWAAPAFQPFREEFGRALATRLTTPLSQLVGLPVGRLLDLAEGQFTLALLPPDDPSQPAAPPTPFLALDTGANAEELADLLAIARQDSRPEDLATLQGREVLGLRLSRARLDAILDAAFPRLGAPPTPPSAANAPLTLHLVQVDSVLLAATGLQALGQVLDRLHTLPAARSPAPSPLVAELRVHGPAFLALLQPTAARSQVFGSTGPSVWRLLVALGFSQLESVRLGVRAGKEGWALDLLLAIPPTARRGLLQLLQFLPADASPPSFIGADAIRFRRARIRGPEAWVALERTLQAIDPSYLGVLQLFTGYAGRTDDADFDFQKGIIQLLGDDWMTASFPREPGSAEVASLLLVGSPQPEKLLHGLRLIASPTYLSTFLPPDSPPPTRADHTLEGHPVVTVTMPPMPWWGGRTGIVHLTHRHGYVALTPSRAVLHRFLASTPAPSLASRPGVGEAAAGSGVADAGYFAFADERALTRRALGSPSGENDLLAPVLRWAALSETATRIVSGIAGWLDFSRLPGPEALAAHLGFSAQSGRAGREGITLTTFRPQPPPIERPLPPPPP